MGPRCSGFRRRVADASLRWKDFAKRFFLVSAALLEQVGLFPGDPGEKRLKLEPTCHVASYLFSCGEGCRVIDLCRFADCFGE